jgi:hypothetical protein
VSPRGTVVLKTTCEAPAELDLSGVVVHEQTLVGSRCGRLAPALEMLARGVVPVERLVQARYPLARADEALAHAGRRGALKVLVERATVKICWQQFLQSRLRASELSKAAPLSTPPPPRGRSPGPGS